MHNCNMSSPQVCKTCIKHTSLKHYIGNNPELLLSMKTRKMRYYSHVLRNEEMKQTKEDGLTENGQMTLSSGVGQPCRS